MSAKQTKGAWGWHGASRDGGIVRCRAGQSPSQPVRLTAPFTQGGLFGSSGSAHQGKNLSFRGRHCRPWESPGKMSPLHRYSCGRIIVPGDCHVASLLAMTWSWCVALVGASIARPPAGYRTAVTDGQWPPLQGASVLIVGADDHIGPTLSPGRRYKKAPAGGKGLRAQCLWN